MAAPSNVPVRPSKDAMSTEPYVRKRKTYAKKSTSYRPRQRVVYMRAPPRSTSHMRAPPRAPPRIATKVSGCCLRYLAAVVNPFEAQPGACVPCDLFPLPSQKIRSFTRGTFNLGTTGFGFISVAPVAANDAVAVTFSTSASVMTSSTALSAVTNLGTTLQSTLPYTTAQVTAVGSVQSRLVGCGIRVRYAGTEAGRGGTVCSYEDGDHTSIAATTYLTTQQFPSAIINRPAGDGSWDGTVCSSGACTPQELEFTGLAYPTCVGSQNFNNAAFMSCVIAGTAGDSYNFEVFQHIEYIGTVVSAKTPSNADTAQFGMAAAALKDYSAVQPVTPAAGEEILTDTKSKIEASLPFLAAGAGLAKSIMSEDAIGSLASLGAMGKAAYDTVYSEGDNKAVVKGTGPRRNVSGQGYSTGARTVLNSTYRPRPTYTPTKAYTSAYAYTPAQQPYRYRSY